MGFNYTNITLKGPSQEEVASYLKEAGRNAYVSPTNGGVTVVYDEACECQDTELLGNFAADLSERFTCPALAVLDHDDAILFYQLFIGGEIVDEYVSYPESFEMEEDEASEVTGDAGVLCSAFGAEENEEIVRAILADRQKYKSEYERHGALLDALGLPRIAVGLGFDAIVSTKQPERIANVGLVAVTGLNL